MSTSDEIFLRKEIFNCKASNFTEITLKLFNFQYLNNDVYRSYCDLLGINPLQITSIEKIPYLPIQFFKNKVIKTTAFEEKIIFESSGTTGSINSKHFIKDISLYEESFLKSFNFFYNNLDEYCIIGLLPSYLERKGSSLVYMVDALIKKTKNKNSGFYLYDFEKLKNVLLENELAKQPTIFIGVTYALLDFAEKNKMELQYTTVMETGGMKGRKEEMSRSKVHQLLKQQLGLNTVHSEYGMTELLSQAYSNKNGIFYAPTHMRILVRSDDDPFDINSNISINSATQTGAINIIDLANLYSCAFIATDDIGKLYSDNSFEIMGRMENTDVRGCGLMLV
jgi:phenylacetate-coenzyme A ligase PaaK-like adenylate-forming protein